MTVVYNTKNTIFGGYLSQSWTSSDDYIKDTRAFILRLQYNGSSNPLKFPVNDSTCAGYGHSNYGPTFGGGFFYDIQTFTEKVTKLHNYSLNGRVCSLGTTYNLNGQNIKSITNESLEVTDLEVYNVEGSL